MYILAWLSRHNVIMPINMGTLLQLSPTGHLSVSVSWVEIWLAYFDSLNNCECDTSCQFTQCYGTSDVLFNAKCDTDNAGELLETPTK